MTGILLSATLRDRGFSSSEIQQMRRRGDLEAVRRGAYLAEPAALTPEERHHRLVEATVPQLRVAGVVSHASAAVLHGLPVWGDSLHQVHLTRSRVGGGKTRSTVQIHTSALEPEDVVVLDGIRVTSLSRTVADVSRALPAEQAVAAGDRALADGLSRAELNDVLAAMRGWAGIGQARRLATLLDRRSESPGESVSRLRFHEAMLPPPVPQFEVHHPAGTMVGRVDFAWADQRVLGEFDGQVKYGRLLKPGETPGEVVYREKLREDALRELGWLVVRWTWAELYSRTTVADRVRRALARSRQPLR